ncbi:hypothetical protein BU202_00070 [Streptococcus cuniculi]|uniref:Uncharacterized protein n=1 Tax=Streptococcus cuniculi TaxID=1432788 RepID=A0A1Q8EAA7_9STRE|nr:hypothetical protein [Streptococcus cuniculi]OLF48727.1 hypothetical protein BU202_00070 [Streptococcus cuniculi]
MDNFSLEIIWRDECEDLIELKIEVATEFVTMYQYCYISSVELINNMRSIRLHLEKQSKTSITFGQMTGQYTPSFSMLLYPKKANDDMLVELDLEIADNDERKHRCQLYVKSKADFWRSFSINVEEMVGKNTLSKSTLFPY